MQPPAAGSASTATAAVEAELSKTTPDLGALRAVLRSLGHVPPELRARVWEALLGVMNKSTNLLEAKIFNEAHDLENQRVVRLDVARVRALGPFVTLFTVACTDTSGGACVQRGRRAQPHGLHYHVLLQES